MQDKLNDIFVEENNTEGFFSENNHFHLQIMMINLDNYDI